jgi:hypothetical protein
MYKRMLQTPHSLSHMQQLHNEANDELQPHVSASALASSSAPASAPANNHHHHQEQHGLSSLFPKKKNQNHPANQIAMQDAVAVASFPQTQIQSPQLGPLPAPVTTMNSVDTNTANIDAVFGRIVEKYNSQVYTIIYNVLLQLQKNNDDSGGDYTHYINGLNQILQPINASIKKWIDENIVF